MQSMPILITICALMGIACGGGHRSGIRALCQTARGHLLEGADFPLQRCPPRPKGALPSSLSHTHCHRPRIWAAPLRDVPPLATLHIPRCMVEVMVWRGGTCR